jgi:hypothetical protein
MLWFSRVRDSWWFKISFRRGYNNNNNNNNNNKVKSKPLKLYELVGKKIYITIGCSARSHRSNRVPQRSCGRLCLDFTVNEFQGRMKHPLMQEF